MSFSHSYNTLICTNGLGHYQLIAYAQPVEKLSVHNLLAGVFLVFFRFCQLSVTLLHSFILCSLSLGNLL